MNICFQEYLSNCLLKEQDKEDEGELVVTCAKGINKGNCFKQLFNFVFILFAIYELIF